MRSTTGAVYENDDLVSGFDASTCSGDHFMTFLRMRNKLLLNIQLFGSTVIKNLGRKGNKNTFQ